jgi:UPF0716 protein FxsA
MGWLIVLAVVSLPVIEFALFAKSAEMIGVLPTVALAVVAGISGITLLQRQGLALMMAARNQFAHGEIPVAATFDALCLTFAGVMFILPGFLTDAVGILLLLPPVRTGLRWWLTSRIGRPAGRPPQQGPSSGGSPIIEAEYRVIGDNDKLR